jgi:Flp pilus assembly pilin Flp
VPVTFTPGHYAIEFGLLVVLGAVILFGVWRSMRVLVAVASLFSGFASGLLGLLSIFYGAWLLLRSWRLQRYGVTDGASVRKVATERATERREAKKAPATPAASGPQPVTSSKRYTPKAKPRKR